MAIPVSTMGAELHTATAALFETNGLRYHGPDFVDAQTSIGLCHCASLRNAKRRNTANIWIQDALERREFELSRVPGEQNPADIITKQVPHGVMQWRLATVECRVVPSDIRPDRRGVA